MLSKLEHMKKQGKDISLLSPAEFAVTSLKPFSLAQLKNAFCVFKKKVNTKGAYIELEREKQRNSQQEIIKNLIVSLGDNLRTDDEEQSLGSHLLSPS